MAFNLPSHEHIGRAGERAMKRKGDLFYYRLNVKDFLASEDFLLLSLEQKGLLFHGMLSCWFNGSLPAAPPELARLLSTPPEQIAKLLPSLARYFSIKGNRLVCPLLDAERRRAEGFSKRNAIAGEKSGEKRRAEAQERQITMNARSNSVEQKTNHSESESYSESEIQSAAASPPPDAATDSIPEAAADSPSLKFLITAGGEYGLTPYEANKLIIENGNGSGVTEEDWESVMAIVRERAKRTRITSAYGLLKTLIEDRRREKAFEAEHPAPPAPAALPVSPFSILDEIAAQELFWNLEQPPDSPRYQDGIHVLGQLVPSLDEEHRIAFAEHVRAIGDRLEGRRYAAHLREIYEAVSK